jgi:hypothetical protein
LTLRYHIYLYNSSTQTFSTKIESTTGEATITASTITQTVLSNVIKNITYTSGYDMLWIFVTAQSTSVLPFRITTSSGHTTQALSIVHSGAQSAAISPDGILYVTQYYGGAGILSNTVINGSLGNPNVQYRSTVIGAGCSIASGAGVGEATAIGVFSTANGQYGTAIGYSANAGNTSVALGFQPSATATRAIAIGDVGTANQTNSCAFGTRATVTGAGNFAWATESSDPSMTFQRLNGSNVLKGLYNINTTWISSTNGAEISRVTIGPMYANSMQEAIRMDSASDLARVGIGGAASGRLCVYTGAAANKGLMIQGFTSQTANLTEWQDSSFNIVARINASGEFFGLLSSGIVVSGDIANNAVVSGNIASGQITGLHLGTTGLTSGYFLRGDANGVLSWATAGGGSVNSGSITQFSLASGAVNSGHIGNNAVVSGSVASGQVSRFHIANQSIFSGHISSSEVGAIHLASGAVVSGSIASGQVGNNHLTSTISNKVIEGDIQTINPQSGTTYTLALSDAGKLVTMTNGSTITLTVPPNSSGAFSIGTHVDVIQLGTGQVTVSAALGVTLNSTPGSKLRAQYAGGSLIKLGTDTWVLVGDISA